MKRIVTTLLLLNTLVRGGEERDLSVEDAVQLALENNRTLHSSLAKVESAHARLGEVSASRLPSLKLQASYTRLSEVDPFSVQVPFSPTPITISPVVLDSYAGRLSVQQPLFTGFRLSQTINAAEYAAHAAEHEHERDQSEIRYLARAAYWNVFKAREFEHTVRRHVEQMQAHLADIQNFVKQGLATENDILKVQVQLSQAQLMQLDASSAARLAAMQLNNLIGLPLDTEIQLSTEAQLKTAEPNNIEQLLRAAFDGRADIKAMDQRMKSSEAMVEASRGGWFPQIALFGSYYYARPNPRILPTKDEFRDTWDVGVMLSFEIWNWGTTSRQTTQAQSTLAQVRNAYAQLKDAVTLEVTQSFLDVKRAREKIEVAARGVEQAEENERTTRNKFKAGLATNTDLLDAEVALLQAQTNYLTAIVDYELSQARLAKALGE